MKIFTCHHYFASFFVIICFIKTINCTTQIHQPITFNYFEHQPITEKNGRSVWRSRENDKNDIRRGKIRFLCKKVFSGERFRIKGLFYSSYTMAISVQNSMLKVNYFLYVMSGQPPRLLCIIRIVISSVTTRYLFLLGILN